MQIILYREFNLKICNEKNACEEENRHQEKNDQKQHKKRIKKKTKQKYKGQRIKGTLSVRLGFE